MSSTGLPFHATCPAGSIDTVFLSGCTVIGVVVFCGRSTFTACVWGGMVMMNINPIIQTLNGITNGLPQTSSREARTSLIVKDGETVVIGGLIRYEDTRTMIKVPIVGDIPIIGQLFRHTNTDHRRSNVIVTITPHILPDSPPVKEPPK